MKREIQRGCFFLSMSLAEFSVNGLGMSPGHVHMTDMTLMTVWGLCEEMCRNTSSQQTNGKEWLSRGDFEVTE